jgi:uncharacterized lipoprotein
MLKFAFFGALMASTLLAGCAGQNGLGCEDSGRYADSQSGAPLRVPDDLSLPDESDSLDVPPKPRSEPPESERTRCLETPPDFSDRTPESTSES